MIKTKMKEKFAKFCETIENIGLEDVEIETISSLQKDLEYFKVYFLLRGNKNFGSNLTKRELDRIGIDLDYFKSAIYNYKKRLEEKDKNSRKTYFYYLNDLCEILGIKNNRVFEDFVLIQSKLYHFDGSLSKKVLLDWQEEIIKNIENWSLLRDKDANDYITIQKKLKNLISSILIQYQTINENSFDDNIDIFSFNENMKKCTFVGHLFLKYKNLTIELKNLDWKNLKCNEFLRINSLVNKLQEISYSQKNSCMAENEVLKNTKLTYKIDYLCEKLNDLRDILFINLNDLDTTLGDLVDCLHQGSFFDSNIKCISNLILNKNDIPVSFENDSKYRKEYFQGLFLKNMKKLSNNCKKYGNLPKEQLNSSFIKQWIAKNNLAIVAASKFLKLEYSFCDKKDVEHIKNCLQSINEYLNPLLSDNTQISKEQREENIKKAQIYSMNFANQIDRNLNRFNKPIEKKEKKKIRKFSQQLFLKNMKKLSNNCKKYGNFPKEQLNSSFIKQWIAENNLAIVAASKFLKLEYSFCDKKDVEHIKNCLQSINKYLNPLLSDNTQISKEQREENIKKAQIYSMNFANQIDRNLNRFNKPIEKKNKKERIHNLGNKKRRSSINQEIKEQLIFHLQNICSLNLEQKSVQEIYMSLSLLTKRNKELSQLLINNKIDRYVSSFLIIQSLLEESVELANLRVTTILKGNILNIQKVAEEVFDSLKKEKTNRKYKVIFGTIFIGFVAFLTSLFANFTNIKLHKNKEEQTVSFTDFDMEELKKDMPFNEVEVEQSFGVDDFFENISKIKTNFLVFKENLEKLKSIINQESIKYNDNDYSEYVQNNETPTLLVRNLKNK